VPCIVSDLHPANFVMLCEEMVGIFVGSFLRFRCAEAFKEVIGGSVVNRIHLLHYLMMMP
jgi:hypothetical protein